MTDWLEPEEVAALTECKRKADQVEWLRANRIPHLIGDKGNPKVLRATIAAILGAPANQSGPALRFGTK